MVNTNFMSKFCDNGGINSKIIIMNLRCAHEKHVLTLNMHLEIFNNGWKVYLHRFNSLKILLKYKMKLSHHHAIF